MTRLALLLLSVCSVGAWISPARQQSRPSFYFSSFRSAAPRSDAPVMRQQSRPANYVSTSCLAIVSSDDVLDDLQDSARRGLLLSSVLSITTLSSPALALVKGNAPPSAKKPLSEKPKCTNVEECQEMAERKQAEDAAIPKGPPPKLTQNGTRYIDMEEGNASKGTVKGGDEVTLYYKVLKLGKRSYDGLNGEGTVVFSRGEP